MFSFHTAFLLFWVHQCSGQIFSPFSFPPPGPPPPFIMFYTFPPVTLQARLGGGLQASIPDDCGVESFEFESRKKATDAWKGGNVTSKTEGNWIFEDPLILLAPGESLYYRCRIKQRGSYISNPDAEWVVPDDLAEEFEPPKPTKKPEDCPEDPTTTTPKPENRKKKTTPKPSDRKEETTAKPDEEEPTGNPEDESTDEPEPEKEKKKPEKKKSPEKMKSDKPQEEKDPEDEKDPKSPECPAPGPKPGETREEKLERKLWKVQCDMIQLAERSFKLNEALSFELTELKKLNYVVVTRIQRLESLLRNLNRPAPFPSPYF